MWSQSQRWSLQAATCARSRLISFPHPLLLLLARVVGQERVLYGRGDAASWRRQYYLPGSSDAAVVALRKWLDGFGASLPVLPAGEADLPPLMPRETVMDRLSSHTQVRGCWVVMVVGIPVLGGWTGGCVTAPPPCVRLMMVNNSRGAALRDPLCCCQPTLSCLSPPHVAPCVCVCITASRRTAHTAAPRCAMPPSLPA